MNQIQLDNANGTGGGVALGGVADAAKVVVIDPVTGLPTTPGAKTSAESMPVALAVDTQLSQLPQFLGPNTADAALPITIASNQSNLDISTQSGVVSVTPVVTAGAYTANRVVGGMLTFTGVTRTRDQGTNTALQTGVLQSIKITSKSVQADTFTAYVFNSSVSASAFADNVAPNIAAADVSKCTGVFTLNNPQSGLGTHTIWGLDGIGKLLNLANTNLYMVLVRSGTTAYASTSDIEVTVAVMRD